MGNTKSIGIAYSDQDLSGSTISLAALDASIIGASGGTVGFYGTAAVTKPSNTLTTAALSSLTTSAVCAMTTTQLQALQSTVNGLVLDLRQLGLVT